MDPRRSQRPAQPAARERVRARAHAPSCTQARAASGVSDAVFASRLGKTGRLQRSVGVEPLGKAFSLQIKPFAGPGHGDSWGCGLGSLGKSPCSCLPEQPSDSETTALGDDLPLTHWEGGFSGGHVLRVERGRGPVWYAKYRLSDGRQVQKKLGPAWTEAERGAITEADGRCHRARKPVSRADARSSPPGPRASLLPFVVRLLWGPSALLARGAVSEHGCSVSFLRATER